MCYIEARGGGGGGGGAAAEMGGGGKGGEASRGGAGGEGELLGPALSLVSPLVAAPPTPTPSDLLFSLPLLLSVNMPESSSSKGRETVGAIERCSAAWLVRTGWLG